MSETPTKLTEEQKRAYLAARGVICPVCKSNRIEGEGFHCPAAVDEVWQWVHCLDCTAKWRDVYKLVAVEDVE